MKKQIYIYENDTYEVKETGQLLLNKGKVKGTPNFKIKYEDSSKDDLYLNEDQIKHFLKFGSWIKKGER